MKRALASFLSLTPFALLLLVAAPASADEPAAGAPRGPTAEWAANAADERIDPTLRNVGIGLTIGGSVGLVGGGVGIMATILANSFSCDDGPCPRPVSPVGQGAVIAATVGMGGALVTGIVLLATSRSRSAVSRVKPTAGGVAFSF